MANCSMQTLVALSSRIGNDLNLVQAGGGNTSLKEDGVLWIKASGKWLARAEEEDIFLPVPLPDVERHLASGQEAFQEYRTRGGVLLRPSVETTMHGVLPQRVVIHVHSVSAIAWASRVDGPSGLAERLAGLRWVWIPYTHPGIPLSQRINAEAPLRPEVLILQNHGLVVAAEDCAAAEKLLHEVERRLQAPVRRTAMDAKSLPEVAGDTDWQLAENAEVHALAIDHFSCEVAQGGTMFPDQCVYLGPAAAVVNLGESPQMAIDRYQKLFEFSPVFLLVRGQGVLTRKHLKPSASELLICLKRVIERIPVDTKVTYLPHDEVARLMNWDAEKYRLRMA